MSQVQAFDVVIVGAGPVGLTLANLLRNRRARTLVLERNVLASRVSRAP
jgi:2-polyprenyl-6-methoxyphenol hydroxylase-like FAD-dependent oxidoreductase